MAKLWGGRFSGETDKQVEQFTSSLHLDQKLWSADITASIAHCQMLKKQNIIPNDEAQKIIFALSEIHEEFASYSIEGECLADISKAHDAELSIFGHIERFSITP